METKISGKMKKKSTSFPKILAIIPARSGSKGIPNKNIRYFCGKPLIAHTVEQALSLKSDINRVIVSTNDPAIAKIALKYGAEVPFLRPDDLAKDNSNISDAIVYTLKKLESDEKYVPDYILLLQSTSPLRKKEDILKCIEMIQKLKCKSVITVCPTHQLLFHLGKDNKLKLVNKSELKKRSNRQQIANGFGINGFAYIMSRYDFIKEKRFLCTDTHAIVCDAWRSVDLDTPEDFILAELIYKNKIKISHQISVFMK
jgi:CMP-N,N'-diacetyllegionaminic acid synthase